MNTQPEALELAELFDRGGTTNALHNAAAEELRRLHEVNHELVEALKKANEQTEHFERLWYLRGDLIEELVDTLKYIEAQRHLGHIHYTASAALAKARGKA